MHDIRMIRDTPEMFEAALLRRDASFAGISSRVLDMDAARRANY